MSHSSMSPKKVVTSLFAAISLTGCINDKPSDVIYENHFRAVINSYDLYKDYFEITALTRKNGWENGGSYTIQGEAKLKSKIDYLELVSEATDELKKELDKNKLGELSVGLIGMGRGMTGEGDDFKAFWQQQIKNNAIPPKLLAMQGTMNQKRFDAIVNYADHSILENYGSIINRNMRRGDELIRVYTLAFKKTEQGWAGFDAK